MSYVCKLEKKGEILADNVSCEFDLMERKGWFEAMTTRPFPYQVNDDEYLLRFPCTAIIEGTCMSGLGIILESIDSTIQLKANFRIVDTI